MPKLFVRAALITAGALLLALSLMPSAQAATQRQAATPTPAPVAITSDAQCLQCHTVADQTMPLPSGESLYITLDPIAFKASLHGVKDVGCTDCHTDIKAYPHPDFKAQNLRQVTNSLSANCEKCHSEQAVKQLDSIHETLRNKGNENAAACADCHNPHYTDKASEPRSKVVTICARCHSGIAQDYRESTHGQALLNDENPDVPVCTDCHGVHNTVDPRTAKFLLNSPKLCADCHADPVKMAPYKLNTNVLNTYVADFHGTTVTLFEQKTPDQLPNTPLCIDCHGVHNIKSAKEAGSTVIKQNLLTTCQKCHPNATGSFSDAWLSHYTPSPDHNPLVYWVGIFYQIFIPTVLGGMALIVVTDAGRRVWGRLLGGRK